MSRPPPKAVPPRKKLKPKAEAVVPVQVYFGRRVKEYRESAGMSQTEFAKFLNVPQPDLPAIERGERDFRLSTADRLAKAIGVPLREMLPEKR